MRVSWKVSLAALCTATLASFSSSGVSNAAPSRYTYDDNPILDILGRKLYQKRDIADIWDVCPLDSSSLAGAMFLHFTAIFFEDFTTGGGTDILGPLAVGGTFTAPNYIVNANRGQDCSVPPTTGLEGIGLVVGGLTATQDTRVHGDSVHAGGGNLEEIKELNAAEGCAVFDDIGTGAMDFEVAENAAIEASLILAASEPNMYIDANGVITDLGSGGSNYKIFTFNTCNNRDCNVPGTLSDPSAILLGEGNFNGPSGDVPSDDDTVVFNIPVTEGETIELKTNFPSQGFYACRTIYNFYPVNSQGIYSADSEITVFRNTGGQIEGFTLAPRAHIRDSTTGAFAGTIIGLDYAWYYGSVGVELHDYGAADDDCNVFAGCLPLHPTATTSYTTITTVQTPTAATVTTTETETTTTLVPPSGTFVGIMTLPIDITLPGSTYTTDVPVTETTETTLTATTYTVVVPAPDPQTTTYETEVPQTMTETFTTVTTDGTSTYTITGTTTEVTEVPTTVTSVISETTVEYVSSMSTVVTTTEVESEETVITAPPTVSTSYSLTTIEPVTSVLTYVTTEVTVITTNGVPTTITTVSPITSWITPTREFTGTITTTIPRSTYTTTIYESTEVLGHGTVYAYPYLDEKKKWDSDKWDHDDKKGGWDDKKDGWGDKKGGWKDDKKGGWDDDKDDEWDDDEWDEDDKEWDDDKDWEGDSDWKKKKGKKGKKGKKYD